MDITRISTVGMPPLGPLKATPELATSLAGAGSSPALAGSGGSFGALLEQAVERVNGLQHDADGAARAFALGQAPSVHDTMIAMEKADLSLRLVTKVRNKVVEAYQDVMRMQI
jgi:flagellar hook-basal body complex protein FliE